MTSGKRSLIPRAINGTTGKILMAIVPAAAAGFVGWYVGFRIQEVRVDQLVADMREHRAAPGHSASREDIREIRSKLDGITNRLEALNGYQRERLEGMKEEIGRLRQRLDRRWGAQP